MSQPDDLDKLLREIDSMKLGQPPGQAQPAREVAVPGEQAPARRGSGRKPRATTGGRLAWTGAGAVGGFVTGGVVGTVLTILPAVSTLSTAVGAALGGALMALVSGPPRWFDDGE